MTGIAVIVGFRDRGDPARRENLKVVLAHLRQADLGEVRVVDDGETTSSAPFNRSRAYNRGALISAGASVLMFHEADIVVPIPQLTEAIKLAALRDGLVVPFTDYNYLSAPSTRAVWKGAQVTSCVPARTMNNGRSVGAVNVVSASTLRSAGRFDEKFTGWGFDDRAMEIAFRVATKRNTRFVSGVAWHLWHVPGWQAGGRFAGGTERVAPEEQRATDGNRQRYRAYLRARRPEEIRRLTAGV